MASIDSKEEATAFCAIPGGRGGKFKWPTLTELYTKLFKKGFGDAHDAAYDVDATARCFFELCKLGVIQRPEIVDISKIKYQAPKLEDANFNVEGDVDAAPDSDIPPAQSAKVSTDLDEVKFSHLHTHSQFSILQGVGQVEEIVQAAVDLGMPACAITDTGNMMSAFLLVKAANKAKIKPIVGIELNVCDDMHDRSHKDDGHSSVFLAKKTKKGITI